MLDVAIYARSSADQSNLLSQIERSRVYAEKMHADSITVYSDLDAGTMLERPGLTAMRLAIQQHRHNCVIAVDRDRLCRGAETLSEVDQELRSAGCNVVFLSETDATD